MKCATSIPALALFALPFSADVAQSQSTTGPGASRASLSVALQAPAALSYRMDAAPPVIGAGDATATRRATTIRHLSQQQVPMWPKQEAHDGNYARHGALIGAITTGALSAFLMGHYAKRNCQPGFCGSDFERGALVGGSVGIAGGGVLGWIIGSSIARH